MTFNVLTIRAGDDPGDDAMYPVLSDVSQPELIAFDRYDGQNTMRVVATAVQVMTTGSQLKTLAKLREVKIDVYITDGRLALACEKYDKGGGWVGFGGAGVLIAATANTVSKIRAANRSRGKTLVGHIRYPWLKSVGASSKTGVLSSEAIRIEFAEKHSGVTTRKLLELTLPKNIDATLVAQEITRRAAAFRLAHYSDMDHEERAKFTELSQAPPRPRPEPKKFAFCQMPTYYFAGPGSAFPSPPGSAPEPPPDGGAEAGDGAARVTCARCGSAGAADDRFCGACGTPADAGSRLQA